MGGLSGGFGFRSEGSQFVINGGLGRLTTFTSQQQALRPQSAKSEDPERPLARRFLGGCLGLSGFPMIADTENHNQNRMLTAGTSPAAMAWTMARAVCSPTP